MSKTWIYIIVAVAVIGAFVFFEVAKASAHFGNQEEGDKPLPDPGAKATLPQGTFPLRVGDQNQLVKNLQEALNKNYGQSLVPDGAWGPKTQEAVDFSVGKLLGKPVLGFHVISQANYNDLIQGKGSNHSEAINQEVSTLITDLNSVFKGNAFKSFRITELNRLPDSKLKAIHQAYRTKYFMSLTRDLNEYSSYNTDVMVAKRNLMKKLNRLQLK